MSNKLSLILKGAAMGIAEVIPGVSGGTIAFITGIYEDLINSIKSFGPEAIEGYKNGGFSGFWTAINGGFITLLLIGMAGGVVVGTFGVTYLLEEYPEPLWGFFFGLIIASALVIGKSIKMWDVTKIIAFILGVIVAYGITVLTPTTGSTDLWYVFISGMIAISALMLPGISGSFILLLMGMYTIIITSLKNVLETFDPASLTIVGVFATGCLVGLVVFSRVLSWLFKNYEGVALSLLTGFLIGALNKVWPWRNVERYMDKETGLRYEMKDGSLISELNFDNLKILYEHNVLPADYYMGDSKTMITILAMIIGFLSIIILERSQ